jgi:hypothetical protein
MELTGHAGTHHNPSTWEAKERRLQLWGQPQKQGEFNSTLGYKARPPSIKFFFKEWSWTLLLYLKQKSTQNELKN